MYRPNGVTRRSNRQRDRVLGAAAADGIAVDDERVRQQLGTDAVRLSAFRATQPMANDGAVAMI